MGKILFLSWFVFSFVFSYSQCEGTIILCGQAEVDEFPILYSACTDIDSLFVKDDDCDPITSFKPLLGIRKVNYLNMWRLHDLNSLEGLDSLEEVEEFYSAIDFTKPVTTDYPSLIKIGKLTHFFGVNNFDFSIYNHVKDLGNLITYGDGLLQGFDSLYNIGNTRIQIVENKLNNDFKDFISDKTDTLKILKIERSKNISLSGLENLHRVDVLIFDRSDSINISGINEIAQINELSIKRTSFVSNSSFQNIENLKTLILIDQSLKSLSDYFPKLLNVTTSLTLLENRFLVNINQLSNSILPHLNTESFFPSNFNINIRSNLSLNDCHNDFICRALAEYPDSVDISGNLLPCSKEDLLGLCVSSSVTTSTNKIEEPPIFYAEYIDLPDEVLFAQIYDFSGKRLIYKVRGVKMINISTLPTGYYFLRFSRRNTVVTYAFLRL